MKTSDLICSIDLNDECKKILHYVNGESRLLSHKHVSNLFNNHWVDWLISSTLLSHNEGANTLSVDEVQLEIDALSSDISHSDSIKRIHLSSLSQSCRYVLIKMINDGGRVRLSRLKSLKINKSESQKLYNSGYLKVVGYYEIGANDFDPIYAVNFAKLKSTRFPMPPLVCGGNSKTEEEGVMKAGHMVNCLYENLKVVHVRFESNHKEYTYKTLRDFQIGDVCIVDTPRSGYAVAKVTAIAPIDLSLKRNLKWIVQKVDDVEYIEAKRKEKMAIDGINAMMIENSRKDALSELSEVIGVANEDQIKNMSDHLNGKLAPVPEPINNPPVCKTCGGLLHIINKSTWHFVCINELCDQHMMGVFPRAGKERDSVEICITCNEPMGTDARASNPIVCVNEKCKKYLCNPDDVNMDDKCPSCKQNLVLRIVNGDAAITCVNSECIEFGLNLKDEKCHSCGIKTNVCDADENPICNNVQCENHSKRI